MILSGTIIIGMIFILQPTTATIHIGVIIITGMFHITIHTIHIIMIGGTVLLPQGILGPEGLIGTEVVYDPKIAAELRWGAPETFRLFQNNQLLFRAERLSDVHQQYQMMISKSREEAVQ